MAASWRATADRSSPSPEEMTDVEVEARPAMNFAAGGGHSALGPEMGRAAARCDAASGSLIRFADDAALAEGARWAVVITAGAGMLHRPAEWPAGICYARWLAKPRTTTTSAAR
jgi:hypothetical protein